MGPSNKDMSHLGSEKVPPVRTVGGSSSASGSVPGAGDKARGGARVEGKSGIPQ